MNIITDNMATIIIAIIATGFFIAVASYYMNLIYIELKKISIKFEAQDSNLYDINQSLESKTVKYTDMVRLSNDDHQFKAQILKIIDNNEKMHNNNS